VTERKPSEQGPSDGAWFAPKRLGYGAGLPIAWQGWVLLVGHMAVLMTGAWLLQGQPVAVMAWVFIMALLPMPLYAAKTRGGWKWRGPGGS
jgi:hypothetical protein